jgi:xanthine dehydrogenase molybdenum-binding subunit
LFEGQLEGSIHMGLGYAISEGMVMANGRPTSTRLRQMGILRAKEMPEMEVIGVDVPDPYGPYGAKGVGEIGLVPTAGDSIIGSTMIVVQRSEPRNFLLMR